MVKVVSTQGLGRNVVRSFGQDLYGWAVAESEVEKPVEQQRARVRESCRKRRLKRDAKKGGKQ